MNRNDALISCRLSDQIEDDDWQRLLETEPGLREKYAAFMQWENDRLNKIAERARSIA